MQLKKFFIFGLVSLMLTACSAKKNMVYYGNLETNKEYKINAGYQLKI